MGLRPTARVSTKKDGEGRAVVWVFVSVCACSFPSRVFSLVTGAHLSALSHPPTVHLTSLSTCLSRPASVMASNAIQCDMVRFHFDDFAEVNNLTMLILQTVHYWRTDLDLC
jgi:hypothetical protein